MVKSDDGDFKLHWETGRRFLAGEFLYANGHDFPYPPFFGIMFAPTALLPMPIAKAIFYPVGVAALLVLLWTMRHLVRSAFRFDDSKTFWATAIALFFAAQFLIRDQAELGLNTGITAFTWLGIYLWEQRRDLAAGVSLGSAIALKCTPAIFLGYFIWKRQWRMAIWTSATALLFTVSPMLWQGPVSWRHHMETWLGNVRDGISGSGFEADEHYRVANMSLRPALLSYLTRSPETSSRPGNSTLSFPEGSTATNKWIANSILLAFLALFLWWSRGAVANRDDPRLLWELAATGVLMVLFSPITWVQHCVALLPACYLVAALLLARDRLPYWISVLLCLFILFCSLLGKDLLGRDLSLFITCHHIATLCTVGLFAIVLAGPRLQRSS